MMEYRYTLTAIRRGLANYLALQSAAARNVEALATYIDLSRALTALPFGLRTRMWRLLIFDGVARYAAWYMDDVLRHPLLMMRRFLNTGAMYNGQPWRSSEKHHVSVLRRSRRHTHGGHRNGNRTRT